MDADLEQLDLALTTPGQAPGLRALALFHGAAVAGLGETIGWLAERARRHGESWERLEEAALQVVAYGGFPRAIDALGRVAALRGEVGPQGSARETRAEDQRMQDGRRVWDTIYDRNAEQVLASLEACSPGFSGWVLDSAYGRILSRGVLGLDERELLAISALGLAALPAPLGSHIRGALRSGSTAEAIRDILHLSCLLADPRSRAAIEQALDRLSRNVYRP